MGNLLNMSRGSLRSLDWAGLAKALIDPTIPFDITGFEVNPEQGVLYCKPNLTGTLTIKNGATKIGTSAFYNCSGITNVIIPDSVTIISSYIFSGCNSLTSVTIPNGVTTINEYTFRACNSLTSITIPNSVTFIGHYAFADCSSLTNVTVEAATPPSLGTFVFRNNASGRIIYVPDASVNAYKTANNWSTYESYIKPISERVV